MNNADISFCKVIDVGEWLRAHFLVASAIQTASGKAEHSGQGKLIVMQPVSSRRVKAE